MADKVSEEKLSNMVNPHDIKSIKVLQLTIKVDEALKVKLMAVKRTRDFKTIADAIEFLFDIYEKVIKDKESNIYNMWMLNDIKRILIKTINKPDKYSPAEIELMKSDLASVQAQLDKFISIVHKFYGRPIIKEKTIDPIYITDAAEAIDTENITLMEPDRFAEKLTQTRGTNYRKLHKELVKKELALEKQELEGEPAEELNPDQFEEMYPFGEMDDTMKKTVEKEELDKKDLVPKELPCEVDFSTGKRKQKLKSDDSTDKNSNQPF